ncbi:MAG: hypothetical protein AB7U20_19930 [Planctomycetaceae bacterium]
MPYYVFWREQRNTDHLAQHGVTQNDFESVVLNAGMADLEESAATVYPGCRGETPDGRLLFCVWEQLDELNIYPVAAYEIGE